MARTAVKSVPFRGAGRKEEYRVRAFGSGGLLTAVRTRALLGPEHSPDLQNVTVDERGTPQKRMGTVARYAAPIAASPVVGLHVFERTAADPQLLIALDNGELYCDDPHFLRLYDSQAEWETGSRYNVSTTATAGSVKLYTPAGPTPRVTTVIQPDAAAGVDSFVREAFPSNNYGSNVAMTTGRGSTSGSRARGFIAFDLSVYAGRVYESAQVALYCYSENSSTDYSVWLYRVTASWTEAVITWNNQPAYTETNGHSEVITGISTWFTWDITTIVNLWLAGTANYGVILYHAQETVSDGAKSFYTSDEDPATNRPKLTLVGPYMDYAAGKFGQAVLFDANDTLKFPTATGAISAALGTKELYINLSRAPGTTDQYVFDGAGAANRNLVAYVKTNGHLVLAYGTGAATVTIEGTTVLAASTWYGVEFKWSAAGCSILLNGVQEAVSATAPSLIFGAYAYLGTKADGTCPLDGLLDEVRTSAVVRTDPEILAGYVAAAEFTWDEYTSYLLHLNGNINPPTTRYGSWFSPVIDLDTVPDLSTGKLFWAQDTEPGASVTLATRSSVDGATAWSAWTALGPGDIIQSPERRYLQVRAILSTTDVADDCYLQSLTVSYGGAPSATLIATLTAGSRPAFVNFDDHCVISDGWIAVKDWDGVTMIDNPGDPAHFKYLGSYNNRVWGGNSSAHPDWGWFSAAGDRTSFPALNFIKVVSHFGDVITGMLSLGDGFVIYKKRSIHLLSGNEPQAYVLRMIVGGKGVLAPASIAAVGDTHPFFATDGIHLFDGTRNPVPIGSLIQPTIDAMNRYRLQQGASGVSSHKYHLGLPSVSSDHNDTDVVYDAIRRVFLLYRGINPGAFVEFAEYNESKFFFGDSTTGQVWEFRQDTFNDGAVPIDAYIDTWDMDFDYRDRLKRVTDISVDFPVFATAYTVSLYFYPDGSTVPLGPAILTIPAGTEGSIHNKRVKTGLYGVTRLRTLRLRFRNNLAGERFGVVSFVVRYYLRRVRGDS